MSDGLALLEAIRRQPDDDALRLVYADWLEETGDAERAEFVRVQVGMESHPVGSPEHARLTDRSVELLTRNVDWTDNYLPAAAPHHVRRSECGGEYGITCSGLWFRRGFVDQIDLPPAALLSGELDRLRPTGPLPTLVFQLYPPGEVQRETLAAAFRRVTSAPLLDRIGDLGIDAGFGSMHEVGIDLLGNDPAVLARLVRLRISEDGVDEWEVYRILESPVLTRLRDLAIDSTDCTARAVTIMARSGRFRGMTDLLLDWVMRGGHGLRQFARPGLWLRLRRLSLGHCDLDDLTLRGLMRPEALPALEILDLAGNPIHVNGVRALLQSGALPRLRRLGLGGTPVSPLELRDLREEFGPGMDLWQPTKRGVTPG